MDSSDMGGKGYRLSIELSDELKKGIDDARKDDAAWQELSTVGKIRVLLAERIEQINQERQK